MPDLSDNHVSNLLTQVAPHVKHDGDLGYDKRVPVAALSNFRSKP